MFSYTLSTLSSAQTCREVVRDASGRIVQTIDRQKSSGGSVQATTRDASGRIIGTATTNTNAGGSAQTSYRDASGRLTGTASTQPTTGALSRTTYRDARTLGRQQQWHGEMPRHRGGSCSATGSEEVVIWQHYFGKQKPCPALNRAGPTEYPKTTELSF